MAVITPRSDDRTAAPARAKVRDRHHRGASRWVVLALVSVGALLMLVPFVLMLLNAFKSPGDYSTNGPLSWPTEFYTKGLVTYWNQVNFPQKLWNSTAHRRRRSRCSRCCLAAQRLRDRHRPGEGPAVDRRAVPAGATCCRRRR